MIKTIKIQVSTFYDDGTEKKPIFSGYMELPEGSTGTQLLDLFYTPSKALYYTSPDFNRYYFNGEELGRGQFCSVQLQPGNYEIVSVDEESSSPVNTISFPSTKASPSLNSLISAMLFTAAPRSSCT